MRSSLSPTFSTFRLSGFVEVLDLFGVESYTGQVVSIVYSFSYSQVVGPAPFAKDKVFSLVISVGFFVKKKQVAVGL